MHYKYKVEGTVYQIDNNEIYKQIFDIKNDDDIKDIKQKFILVSGIALTRDYVNKNMLYFTEKAFNTINLNKKMPALLDHDRSINSTVGTIVKLDIQGKSLIYNAVIPNVETNKKLIDLLKNDMWGIVKVSIGGVSDDIQCSICNAQLRNHYDHYLGEKVDGKQVYGIVNHIDLEEISFTINPADDTTSSKIGLSMVENGIELSYKEFIDKNNNEYKPKTFINQKNSDNIMEDEDNSNVVLKLQEDIAELKNSISALVEFQKKQEEQRKLEMESRIKEKAVKLSEMIGKTVEELSQLDERSLDLMLETMEKLMSNVPDEKGKVDNNSNNAPKQTKTDVKQKLYEAFGIKMNDDLKKRYQKYWGNLNLKEEAK